MNLFEIRHGWRIPFSFGLLIFSLLIFVSCGGQEVVEESAQEVPEPQEKVNQLEKELTEKEALISELRDKNADLENRMPVPHEVQIGDSHWEIAYSYLAQQKGLPQEEAAGMLSETLLYHPIMVGFKIWNYYSDGTFGSFITQGTATVSPGSVMRLKKKEAKEEKNELEVQIEDLQSQKQETAEKIDRMQKDYEAEKNQLNDQITALEGDVKEAEVKAEGFEEKLNSVYYLVGSKEALKDRDKIKGTFLGICGTRIKDISFADFQDRIDLRETDSITLNASDLGVSQIKEVGLLPKHLEDGEDYRIEIAGDRRSARVILLNKETALLARLIIFVN